MDAVLINVLKILMFAVFLQKIHTSCHEVSCGGFYHFSRLCSCSSLSKAKRQDWHVHSFTRLKSTMIQICLKCALTRLFQNNVAANTEDTI